jgi:hypothetical protein
MGKGHYRSECRRGDTEDHVDDAAGAPGGRASLPPHLIPALVAKLASEQVALSAVQGLLTARLLNAGGASAREDVADRLLTAEEVAATLEVTKRWVQRRARRLPFARRISDHAIRYSEAGLKRWLALHL